MDILIIILCSIYLFRVLTIKFAAKKCRNKFSGNKNTHRHCERSVAIHSNTKGIATPTARNDGEITCNDSETVARNNKNLSFVSVVVPARNEEKNIRNCINSILNSNYPKEKYEIIIVNDRSTDNTLQVINELANANPNIKICNIKSETEKRNLQGKPGAIKVGIDAAAGEIIMMTDADCTVNENWILTVANSFEMINEELEMRNEKLEITNEENHINHTNQINHSSDNNTVGAYGIRPNNHTDLYEKQQNCMNSYSSVLKHTELYENNENDLMINDKCLIDKCLMINDCNSVKGVCHTPLQEPIVGAYGIRPNNTTDTNHSKKTGMVCAYTNVKSDKMFHYFQAIEWYYMHTFACAGIGIDIVLGCFGNNISITKEAYNTIGGFDNLEFSVTEDFVLLNAIFREGFEVKYLCDKNTTVETLPVDTFTEYMTQRKRWSIGAIDLGWKAFVYVFSSVCLWLAIILSAFNGNFYLMIISIALRFLGDALILFPVFDILGIRYLKKWIPFSVCFYSLIELILPFTLLSRTVKWKDQTFNVKRNKRGG